MSSEFGQNPSITHSNYPPKVTKNGVSKSKSSKRSGITKANKNNNNNNIKVVHISNPMKFEVNADEFQALVQGLTGRDAVDWPYDNINNTYFGGSSDVASAGGGVVSNDEVADDEVQQEPLMEDDLHQVVQMDGYDGSSSDISSLDYYGAFEGDVVYGDGGKNNGRHLVNMEYFQAYMNGNNL